MSLPISLGIPWGHVRARLGGPAGLRALQRVIRQVDSGRSRFRTPGHDLVAVGDREHGLSGYRVVQLCRNVARLTGPSKPMLNRSMDCGLPLLAVSLRTWLRYSDRTSAAARRMFGTSMMAIDRSSISSTKRIFRDHPVTSRSDLAPYRPSPASWPRRSVAQSYIWSARPARRRGRPFVVSLQLRAGQALACRLLPASSALRSRVLTPALCRRQPQI
jgi:hypothetical protein